MVGVAYGGQRNAGLADARQKRLYGAHGNHGAKARLAVDLKKAGLAPGLGACSEGIGKSALDAIQQPGQPLQTVGGMAAQFAFEEHLCLEDGMRLRRAGIKQQRTGKRPRLGRGNPHCTVSSKWPAGASGSCQCRRFDVAPMPGLNVLVGSSDR